VSDFIGGGWPLFIAIVTVASLVACLALLVIAARRRVMTQDGADDNTTGHVWDEDLRELNNPLPRWWMWLFVGTVAFSAIYLLFYPGLATWPGSLKWSSSGQWQDEQARAKAAMEPIYARFAGLPAEALAKDATAMGIGQRLFINHCAQCHGSDGRGSKGFPNLTDNDWLWGGTPEKIAEIITQGRQGNMPAMAAAVGTAEDVRNVAHYVMSLSGSPHNSLYAQLGRPKFGVCAACHGAGGQGNPALGAPNLADDIWLHGFGEAAITAIITQGRVNAMPAQAGLLTPEQIQVLAAYVWQLSRRESALASR
jgi:cytochrome c oxidase cbb3-type subunit III